MKCFNHENREAAAACQRCGKGLFRECAGRYTPCLCDDCFSALQQEAHAQQAAAAEGRRQSRLEQLNFTAGDLILNCLLGSVLCGVVLFVLIKKAESFQCIKRRRPLQHRYATDEPFHQPMLQCR